MVEHFRKGRQEVLYFDLTPPEMESLSIFTARVVVPDFQPIWFGRGERRIGGDRMFRFPTDQGINRASAVQRTADQLNPLPHPLA
jgi:hypothetical protein